MYLRKKTARQSHPVMLKSHLQESLMRWVPFTETKAYIYDRGFNHIYIYFFQFSLVYCFAIMMYKKTRKSK